MALFGYANPMSSFYPFAESPGHHDYIYDVLLPEIVYVVYPKCLYSSRKNADGVIIALGLVNPPRPFFPSKALPPCIFPGYR